MPVKPLPPHPNLDHLKSQARDLLKARASRDVQAAQRIREFHPRFQECTDAAIFDARFRLSDAQLTIARERGFASWTLLEFVAENPVRRGTLPDNIVEVAKVILDAGAKEDQSALTDALGLVSTGCVPRECRMHLPLIDLLCAYGDEPTSATRASLAHRELEAVDALLRNGARIDLVLAAGLGRLEDFQRFLPASTDEECHRALALASQHGHAEIVRLLLDGGRDPNRYNPVGFHAHSTPLHQAAAWGHDEVVRLLVEHGAWPEMKDTAPGQGTPASWARHQGHKDIEEYLQARGARGVGEGFKHIDCY